MNSLELSNNRQMLARSHRVLASASTFSKVQLFETGNSPFCLTGGQGARTWDVDGNVYIDYIIALGCLTLGHQSPIVNDAIREQLEHSICLSLPSPLETEVGEMLIESIPCAEKIKLGKNGNDVTSAAVRIARFHTGRDHILFCGYHGWQDWYISQTSKNGGIPGCVGQLSHRFNYNDIDSIQRLVKQYSNEVACIIMEPLYKEWPNDGFLENVRDLCIRHGIVLIFDEVVTGFRFHKGGAQTLLGVTPDLACFSKAIANGMPLSVLVGKAEIMNKFQDIFFSLTNAGETLSLAAARAVLSFHGKEDVPKHLAAVGRRLHEGITTLLQKYGLNKNMSISGFDCRFGIGFNKPNQSNYDPTEDLLYFVCKCAEAGILTNGGFMVSWAHDAAIIDETLERIESIMPSLRSRLLED